MYTYKDKTWCFANCVADGACGRMLMPEDLQEIGEQQWLVSFADFSSDCELFVPPKEADDAI